MRPLFLTFILLIDSLDAILTHSLTFSNFFETRMATFLGCERRALASVKAPVGHKDVPFHLLLVVPLTILPEPRRSLVENKDLYSEQ